MHSDTRRRLYYCAAISNVELSPALMLFRRLIHGGAWDIPHELHDAHARGQDPFITAMLFQSSHHRRLFADARLLMLPLALRELLVLMGFQLSLLL